MERNVLLVQGCRIAKFEGMKQEKEMIRELIDLAIENRDREGFNFLKEKHNNLVMEIKELRKEIDKDMEIINKDMEDKLRNFVDNLDHEEIIRMIEKIIR